MNNLIVINLNKWCNCRGYLIGCFVLIFGLNADVAAFAEKSCDSDLLNEIKGEVNLPSNCTYHRSITITEGHTLLDCHGSTFVGRKSDKYGLLINSQGKPMSDVTIRNCGFIDYVSNGIRVAWSEIDAVKGDNREEIYKRTPTRIRIDNVLVKNTGRVGIYLDDYVTDVAITNSVVVGSGGVGIYLEHSSKNNKLIGNKIIGNGFGSAGKPSSREGVAIDSSAENLIENNTFKENAGGGIFLYKNCGEHMKSGRQVIRWQHSDLNVIKNNIFNDEKVGIWLASRQQKNLTHMECGDAPVNRKGWYADFADSNSIENNTFCRTSIPVKDFGKNNQISGSKSFCVVGIKQ